MQVATDTSTFLMRRSSYISINFLGWLWCLGYTGVASSSLVLSTWLWSTSSHTITIFIQWQEILCALLWFVAIASLAGAVFVMRFLSSTRMGYRKSMLTIGGEGILLARDLSAENFLSIFYVLYSGFLCFCLLLAGLLPEVLAGWLRHLIPSGLVVPGSILLILLGIAGFVISSIAGILLGIGCVGMVSTCGKIGKEQSYRLNDRLNLHIDGEILTISYPGKAETMLDLHLLSGEDQKRICLWLQKQGDIVQSGQEDFPGETGLLMEEAPQRFLLVG